ncbi:MAG: hypothetical protein ACPHL6_11685 [Rubripirellula sp.]
MHVDLPVSSVELKNEILVPIDRQTNTTNASVSVLETNTMQGEDSVAATFFWNHL